MNNISNKIKTWVHQNSSPKICSNFHDPVFASETILNFWKKFEFFWHPLDKKIVIWQKSKFIQNCLFSRAGQKRDLCVSFTSRSSFTTYKSQFYKIGCIEQRSCLVYFSNDCIRVQIEIFLTIRVMFVFHSYPSRASWAMTTGDGPHTFG